MLFSRKNILIKGRKPLYAASKVINASSASASSVFAKCWVHSTNKTSALIRKVRNRAYYATNATGGGGGTGGVGPGSPGGAGHGTGWATSAASGLPLYRRVINAWTQTPTKWYPLPLAVGALLLVAIQYRKKARRARTEVEVDEDGMEVIRLKGPWQVHVLGALPLRNMSRLWGYVNSLELPVWFRPFGLRLYAYAFGCNLDEIEPTDLRAYPSLGAFFYRKLKDGVRPVDNAVLVSPADGTMLHFGTIQDLHIEQVKGITYSLDALLGVERPGSPPPSVAAFVERHPNMPVFDDCEFANVNGIEYSLNQLIGGESTPDDLSGTATPTNSSSSSSSSASTSTSTQATSAPPTPSEQTPLLPKKSTTITPTISIPHRPSTTSPSPAEAHPPPQKYGPRTDESVLEPSQTAQETLARDASVALEMGGKPNVLRRRSTASGTTVRPGNALYFAVIYLAPGDYHRFHSPTAWVVERRRHFVGELYSVSPYVAKRLQNLFVLNERVALLGRWRHGFFGMVPVGAANVGSIKVNFDQALRTNVRGRLPPPGTYTEAVYSAASPLLNGQPLHPAQEMGGFCLGSTIVLVFEAPDEFEFAVQHGQKVRVGQRLGDVSARSESARGRDGERAKED